MHLLAALLCSCCLLLPACDPGPAKAPRAGDPLAAVELDGGKQWTVDAHVRGCFAEMRQAVQAATDPSPAATTALGRQLQTVADRLIEGCTMTGAAHDALHAYLGTLLPAVHTMAGADQGAAQAARALVKTVLERFGEFFR